MLVSVEYKGIKIWVEGKHIPADEESPEKFEIEMISYGADCINDLLEAFGVDLEKLDELERIVLDTI